MGRNNYAREDSFARRPVLYLFPFAFLVFNIKICYFLCGEDRIISAARKELSFCQGEDGVQVRANKLKCLYRCVRSIGLHGALIPLVMLFLQCDHGLGLMETKISGRLIFLHPENRPASVESVWLVAAEKSLFENPQLDDVVTGDRPVDFRQDTTEYELFVPEGVYTVLAAIYKEKGKDWNYLNILGLYGFDPRTFTYTDDRPIEISSSHKVASGKDIICDWAFVFRGGYSN